MSYSRRRFIGHSLMSTALLTAPGLLGGCRGPVNKKGDFKIDRIELYRYDSNIPRYFSWGTWYNRQQVFMKMTSGSHVGWSETNGSTNNPDLDLKVWGSFLRTFKGMDVYEAYDYLKRFQGKEEGFNLKQLEFIEMNLLDLIGKIEEKPAIELLGLEGRDPLPGLFCILNKDLKEIEENLYKSIEQDLSSFVKVKMYGEHALDLEIAGIARKLLGEEAFVLSDVNKGYKDWTSLDELSEIMVSLRERGLNACEDPAELSNAQWKELQAKVGDLSLIPDYVLRPSWEGIDRIEEGMGRYYNLHPDTMGSFHLLPALGEKVKSIGGGIMVGDNSLVGPGCNAWEQVAIGLGASWVEAIEKEEDSESYLECILSRPTFRNEKGWFAMDPKPGFGLALDEDKLRTVCPQVVAIA